MKVTITEPLRAVVTIVILIGLIASGEINAAIAWVAAAFLRSR